MSVKSNLSPTSSGGSGGGANGRGRLSDLAAAAPTAPCDAPLLSEVALQEAPSLSERQAALSEQVTELRGKLVKFLKDERTGAGGNGGGVAKRLDQLQNE